MIRTLLAVYACLSAVYLIYLPHALPVLDDWADLRWFERAWAGAFGGPLACLQQLIDNTWIGQARLFWTSFLPVHALSSLAGFTYWPYLLFAWTAHLLYNEPYRAAAMSSIVREEADTLTV